jgi:hypothetical protein
VLEPPAPPPPIAALPADPPEAVPPCPVPPSPPLPLGPAAEPVVVDAVAPSSEALVVHPPASPSKRAMMADCSSVRNERADLLPLSIEPPCRDARQVVRTRLRTGWPSVERAKA